MYHSLKAKLTKLLADTTSEEITGTDVTGDKRALDTVVKESALPSGAATSAIQTDGTQKTQVTGDGAWGDTGTNYEARVTSDGELTVTSTERERNVVVHYQNASVAATEYSILVDLSDTTNFPHDATGRIDVSWMKIDIEKSAANVIGEIEVGMITRIDGTDADISYLTGLQFLKGSDTNLSEIMNYQPSQLKFAAGRFITNVTETNVAAVNTGTTLDSANGSITPGLGDVIIKQAYTSGGNYDFDIEILYHSEA